MASKNIFEEIRGIVSWLNSEEYKELEEAKRKKREKETGIVQPAKDMLTPRGKIIDLLSFLKVDAVDEEIDALVELSMAQGKDYLDPEDIINYFLRDEKTVAAERESLKNAFKLLNKCIVREFC
eukprot:TRINITY_DN5333_c0_g1_i3.p1 TRINITY_DN5333_c0_g1~~TRINITY_DN5333_c0_g1_i3.p1  ORF type:complete len:124 (-),score=39.97 TRINITY_DN5333_c0_g1_i3:286-657(-)